VRSLISFDLYAQCRLIKKNLSVLFLYRDRFLALPKNEGPEQTGEDPDGTIDRLFVTAQHIGAILSSLESCATPVITPYAGFSVFVAAHINMYGTVCPARYPGGLARAEGEKKSNLEYLERLCGFWDVGTSWVCHNVSPRLHLILVFVGETNSQQSGEPSRKQTDSMRPPGQRSLVLD
jgi:hypothetical protein